MTRWLPYPLLSFSLLVMWLLLNQSVSPAHLILGSVLAIVGAWIMAALRPTKPRFRRWGSALRLLGIVLADITRSNIAVARIIARPDRHERTSGFMTVPLEMRSHYGLATLACVITATPGTIWVSYDPARGTLLIHVLDLVDEQAWVRLIKHRYERLLMEIFE